MYLFLPALTPNLVLIACTQTNTTPYVVVSGVELISDTSTIYCNILHRQYNAYRNICHKQYKYCLVIRTHQIQYIVNNILQGVLFIIVAHP